MNYSFRNSGFRDPETGVYNNTYFMEVFNREWHRHQRDQQTLALLYLCPHIHETVKQEHLLELFTHQVQQALLRTTDLLARLDSTHFALGLFNVDSQGTQVVLDRISHQIDEFILKHGREHNFTIDYKVAAAVCTPSQDNKIETLFKNVEQLSFELESNQDSRHALVQLH
jgi:diguanylate cyclase (GGDEF)-like protein